MAGPLQGLKVIELGQVLAGPFAGAIFADLGAEVIKIERLEGGDDGRCMGAEFRHGDALNFHVFNRGKHSVALDLRVSQGLDAFHTLVAEADVLIHNLRPDVPRALGIDAASLGVRYPRLIYGEISAFGHRGPMADRPGYEPLIQAFSGLSSMNGGPDDPPLRAGASLCDQGSGMWLVIGVLSMLHQRGRSGRGGLLQTSLLETALAWAAQKSDAFVNEGRLPLRHRSGHPGFVPYEAFETADGPLLICCGNDRLFAKLAQVLGQEQWLQDARFESNRARLENKQALLAELEPLLHTRSRAKWVESFEAVGVPCAPIHSLPQALATEQVRMQEMLLSVPGEGFSLTGMPLSFDGYRPAIAAAAPRLGEHNSRHGITALAAQASGIRNKKETS
ncbi:CaiB/BaiF CoA transferase family protein [Comamonas testosteroni]|uniref:Carnitine dehydratase n=1 Tax=Comamonas testosteroni TaxID=285 RepID=A0A096FR94_COMTE|nr:CoA transferase [Comamonas testosteroni]KGH32293.1 carnitine dehydratase [Comamonas testosteroni]